MHANNTPRKRGSQLDKSSEFVRAIWRHQPGDYFCISIAPPCRSWWHDQPFHRDKLDDIGAFIRRGVDEGYDVFFTTNGCRYRNRDKTSAIRGVWLYADLDKADVFKVDPEPTIAIMTSPGHAHAWWKCDGLVSGDLAMQLRIHIGADRGSGACNKPLRIPGTINYKPGRNRARVRLLWDDGPTYRVAELEKLLLPERLMHKRRRRTATAKPERSIENRLRWASARKYMYEAIEGQRSCMIAGLIYTLHDDGYGADDIVWALMRCPSFIDKRGRDEDRAYEEIDNCLRNKT